MPAALAAAAAAEEKSAEGPRGVKPDTRLWYREDNLTPTMQRLMNEEPDFDGRKALMKR